MTMFPEYQDIYSITNLRKGGFPCFVSKQILQENIPLHHHDFIELSLVTQGTGTEIINGVAHELKPGAVTFLLPHHLHQIQIPPTGSLQKYCCMFDISILFGSQTDADLGSTLLRTGSQLASFVHLSCEDAGELQAILEKIELEFHVDKAARNSYLRAKLIEALVLYVRALHVHSQETEHINSQDSGSMIWNVIQYTNTHYMNRLSLDHLSAKFATNASTISRLFKKEMGQSFLEYVHQLRIRRACGLLLNTDMNIFQIAEESGFESFRTFSRVFKEIKGMSASDFRNTSSFVGKS